MDPIEKFKTTLEIRNMEIKLYWERSNFFLALNTAIAIGFFALKDRNLTLPLAVLGFISALLWFLVNLGSKFWQARWEEKLRNVEAEAFPQLKMFTQSYDEIRESVEENLRRQSKSLISRMFLPAVLSRPSVSSIVIYLSFTFCAFWLILVIKYIWALTNG